MDGLRVPVLVLGHGITHLGVIRSLGRAGITAYSITDQPEYLPYSRYFQVPPGKPIENPRPSRLTEILKELPLERAVLMPCADDWVKAVAELPAELARRFPVSMPPRPIVEAMLDKWCFSELLEREEVPHPKTWLLRSMEEAEALPEEEFEGAFLKPRVSQEFSRRYKVKAFSAKNREEALQLLRKTFEDGMAMVLQEYIPGPLTSHHLIEGFVDQHGRPTWFAR